MGYWTIVGLATLIALVSTRFLPMNAQVLDAVLWSDLLSHPIPF